MTEPFQINAIFLLMMGIGVAVPIIYSIIAAHVGRKSHQSARRLRFLALVGILLLESAVPALTGSPGHEINRGIAGRFSPRVGGTPVNLYTIGVTGSAGYDNTHLDSPIGVAVNATGHAYVVDTNNQRVQVFDSDGVYQYTMGVTGSAGSDNAHFNFPTGSVANFSGHLYVIDNGNHRVQVFDNAGGYQYTMGVTGNAGSDNAHFDGPWGMAVNTTSHVYIADIYNHRVQVFDKAGVYQYTLGVTGISGSDNTHFSYPQGVAVNSSGYTYVLDSGNCRVQVFDNAGIYQYTIGTGFGSGNYEFGFPTGIAVNGTGLVYVVDPFNHRVQVFDNAGIYQYILGETGVTGTDDTHFNGPYGVAVSANGLIYVADSGNNRVQIFGAGIHVSINNGAVDTTTLDVSLTVAASDATEMCFSNNGTTYTDWEAYGTSKAWTLDGGLGLKTVYFKGRDGVTETGPVTDTITYTLPPTGLSITIDGGATETGITSVTLTLSATGAAEMCFSNNGTTYTAWEAYDTTKSWTLDAITGIRTVYFKARNSTIEAATPVTDTINYVAPSGLSVSINNGAGITSSALVTLGISATGATQMCFSNDGISYSGWEAYGTSKVWILEEISGLRTVYFKARNGIYEAAAPATDTITYSPGSPIYVYTIGSGYGSDNNHFALPCAVAVDATGHTYIADTDNQRVQVFDSDRFYLYTIGVTGVTGSDNAHFFFPEGVAVNATGHLYVADSWNHRVQVFNMAGIYQYTIGVSGVSGSDNFHFNMPRGVAVNATGHTYIADTDNQRVQVFDKAGIYQYTIGVSGVSGSDNAHLASPTSVVVNATGYLYIGDRSNSRVQVFDKAGTYQYTIGTGYGTGNYQFNIPYGVAINNATGHVYVGDQGNHRVQAFDCAGAYLSTIGVTGVSGSDNAHFNYPTGVAVDTNGHLYVVDLNNHRVQVFDPPAPSGLSFTINNGAADTTTLAVTLTMAASGATEMCFSNNGTTYTAWEAYGTSKAWTLDGGLGLKTVYFRARCYLSGAAPVSETITYTLPPTGLSILIDGGAAETGSISVTLTLSASGATEMCFSNNGTMYTAWEAYGTTKAWTLDAITGIRTVFFKVRNSTIEAAAPATDTITYVAPPSDLSVMINSGALDTSSTSVTLTLSATGATEMCFSNNGTTYTAWEAYGTTKSWTLDAITGIRTVYFKARNSTIEVVAPVTDSITYILQPTGLTITINSGVAETVSISVTLTLTATGAIEMCFSNNGTMYTDWEAYSTSKVWTLAGGPGPKTVYFKARNSTIEAVAPVTDSITYILQPTGLTITINSGLAETVSISVTLTLTATGATEMCFSNDGVTWSEWEPFALTKAWVLDNNAGLKRVYFKARNSTVEADAPVSDSITFSPPGTGVDLPLVVGVVMVCVSAGLAAGIAIMKFRAKKHRGSR